MTYEHIYKQIRHTRNETLNISSEYNKSVEYLLLFLYNIYIQYIYIYSKKCDAAVINSDITDHFPIILSMKLNQKKSMQVNRFCQKTNFETLHTFLNNESWLDVLNDSHPDTIAEKLTKKIKFYLEKSTEQILIPNKHRCLKPWITTNLVKSIRYRNNLKKNVVRSNYCPRTIKVYTDYRDCLTRVLRNAKYSYYKEKISQNLNDPKKMWWSIQEASNEYHEKSCIKLIKKENGQTTSDLQEIANEMNNFFSTIGKKLASKIQPRVQTYDNLSVKSMFLKPVSEAELINIIGSLKNTNSCGEDGISSKVLKENHKSLIKPFIHLINTIFSSGYYPKIFKQSVVIPIHKSGDKTDKNNYRPIALCSVLNKVVEKSIKVKLWEYLEENKIISPHQFGFKPGVSTDNALNEVNQFITKSLNKDLKPIVVFLDLKKAFDTVAHPILLKRLESIGVRGVVHRLFESYLDHRYQKVKLNDIYSEVQQVEVGVPQGTVLGPILFSLYVNSLLKLKIYGKVVCFADDTALLIAGNSWLDACTRAELDLHKIKCWLDSNQLTLNIDKTKFISFSMTKRGMSDKNFIILHDSSCKVTSNCNCQSKIQSCDSIKYLGVYFDRFLKWDAHSDYVSKKIRKLVYKFSQLRHILTFQLTKMVYYSLAESVLNYGILCWGSACESVLLPLRIAQKYVLKILLFKPKMYSTDLLFSQTEFLNLRQLYCVKVIQYSLNYKLFQDIVNHSIQTRAVTEIKLCTSLQNYSATQRNILFTGPRLLNLLPLYIRNKQILTKTTKKKIRDWVKINYKLIIKSIVWFSE